MKDEMDILKEVSTTAAAQGSDALSKMIGRRINLTLPKIDTVDSADFFSKEEKAELVLSVQCKILTGLEGKLLLTLKEKAAFRLIRFCYPQTLAESSGVLDEISMSVLKEIGNVVIASLCGALSMFLKKVVIPSPPLLVTGPLQEVINAAFKEESREYILVVDAIFEERSEKIKGRMEFILTDTAVKEIRDACKKALEDLHR